MVSTKQKSSISLSGKPKWPDFNYNNTYEDWKDKAAYEKYKTLKDFEYGWEFLRRSPDYIRSYIQFQQELKDKGITDYSHPDRCMAIRNSYADSWQLVNFYKPGTSCFQLREWKQMPSYRNMTWSISHNDPAVTQVRKADQFPAFAKSRTLEAGKKKVRANPYVVIAFDARRLILPMLDDAKNILQQKQSALKEKGLQLFPKSSVVRRKLPLYLRLIDALKRPP